MDSAAMKYDYASLNSLLRDQASVVHSQIRSLPLLGCKQQIRFLLMRPECGSICPITHEPIATSTLNSEAINFDPEHPDRKAIRLPCQHEFTATCLLFYWLRNDTVRCPMCRAEPPCTRLNVHALPSHLQLDIPESVGSLSDGSDETSDSEPDEPVYSWSVGTKTFEEMFNNLHIEQSRNTGVLFGRPLVGPSHPNGLLFRPSGTDAITALLQRPKPALNFQFTA